MYCARSHSGQKRPGSRGSKRSSRVNNSVYKPIRNVDSSAEMSSMRVRDELMYKRTDERISPIALRRFCGGRMSFYQPPLFDPCT